MNSKSDQDAALTAQAISAEPAGAVYAELPAGTYFAKSVDGKQHNTGKVCIKREPGHPGGWNYFATTASPEDAQAIADAMNAFASHGQAPAGATLGPDAIYELIHGFGHTTHAQSMEMALGIADLSPPSTTTQPAPQQEAQEPYAYAVYFPDQPKVELVHELDDLIDDLTNRPHVVTKLYTAPQPSPAAQGDAIEHELAMLIRRIVSSARRNCQDGSNVLKLANEAWAYLVRKGLVCSPLRDAGIESDVAPQAADSVLEDAARLDWLDQQCGGAYGFEDMHEGNRWEISGAYANVREAIDAARKQGGSHD